jgi:hypothetical protein
MCIAASATTRLDSVLPAVSMPQLNWWSIGMPPAPGARPPIDATAGMMVRRCGGCAAAVVHWFCPVYEPPNNATSPVHQG